VFAGGRFAVLHARNPVTTHPSHPNTSKALTEPGRAPSRAFINEIGRQVCDPAAANLVDEDGVNLAHQPWDFNQATIQFQPNNMDGSHASRLSICA
jgi:hypothetical protein